MARRAEEVIPAAHSGLGGGSLIRAGSDHELNELKRITADVYAIFDCEKTAATDSLSPDRVGCVSDGLASRPVQHPTIRQPVEQLLRRRRLAQREQPR